MRKHDKAVLDAVRALKYLADDAVRSWLCDCGALGWSGSTPEAERAMERELMAVGLMHQYVDQAIATATEE